ncbi:MAG TPA: SGNH/GDSL hydrolase family protein [Gemmatimonadales bacterium]|nr:SGNH/GDSL hydrolase family protein [Gemmatimonadales bacterium]
MRGLAAAGRLIRDGWLVLGLALALCVLVEGGFRLAARLGGGGGPEPDWRVAADAYPDRSWVGEYYREFRSSDAVRWRPYVYWRRGPYHGRFINVDTAGVRRTIAPDPATASRTIFMFGGSALWGTGARDGYTIPSLLARELEGRGIRARVVNFGESGYVSTQELIALLLRLREGDRPDLVILYDGANDTYSAYQQHLAGLPQNEFNRVKEFNLSSDLPRLRATALHELAAHAATVRALRRLVGQSRPASAGPAPPAEVLRAYAGNVELVRALGRQYGFASLAYWQPTVFDKATLTGYETAERGKARAFEPFFRETYAALRRSPLARGAEPLVRDLGATVSSVREPVFVDWVHLGERGNALVARRIADDVAGALGTRPTSGSTSKGNRR